MRGVAYIRFNGLTADVNIQLLTGFSRQIRPVRKIHDNRPWDTGTKVSSNRHVVTTSFSTLVVS